MQMIDEILQNIIPHGNIVPFLRPYCICMGVLYLYFVECLADFGRTFFVRGEENEKFDEHNKRGYFDAFLGTRIS